MGSGQSKSVVLGKVEFPPYCLKSVAGNYLVVAGGGGAAKTGVANEIAVYSFAFNHQLPDQPPVLQKCARIDTKLGATMNLDLIYVEPGRFLLAAGQDDHCCIYSAICGLYSNGISTVSPSEQKPNRSVGLGRIGFSLKAETAVRSDFHPRDSYQKVVKIDQCGRFIATGGADGHLRLWQLEKQPAAALRKLLEVKAHEADFDDLDVSGDGSVVVTVGRDGKCVLWSVAAQKSVFDVRLAGELLVTHRIKFVRFTSLGIDNKVFVTCAIPKQMSTKNMASHLTLWAYSEGRGVCQEIITKKAISEVASALCVSTDGEWTAMGTLSGSIAVFSTHDFTPILINKQVHEIFVTDVEFVPPIVPLSLKEKESKEKRPTRQPSVISSYPPTVVTGVVSVSADQTLRLHLVHQPSERSWTFYLFLYWTLTVLLYLFLRAVGL